MSGKVQNVAGASGAGDGSSVSHAREDIILVVDGTIRPGSSIVKEGGIGKGSGHGEGSSAVVARV